MDEDEKTKSLLEVEAAIKKYKKVAKEDEEKSQVVTKEDLQKLLKQIQKEPTVESQPMVTTPMTTTPTGQTMVQQKQPTKKEQIAYQLWRDSKATTIVCLIAIILPVIAILITMFPDGQTYALVAAMLGMIYPCFIFAKSISIQSKLYQKYGFKPMLQPRYRLRVGRPPMQQDLPQPQGQVPPRLQQIMENNEMF